MRKSYSFILLIIQTFCFPVLSTLSCRQDRASLVQELKPAVVTILTFALSEPPYSFPYYVYDTLSQGSGFFVNANGDVITNFHVLYNADSAIVRTADGKIYKITNIIAEDRNSDIIMAETNAPHDCADFLRITADIPIEGDDILVIGSPFGLEHTVSNGIVSSIRTIEGMDVLIQITAPISPGSSGGPVINMKGQVIGVATFQMIEGQNLNFAIPGVKVVSLLSDQRQELSFWNANIRCNEIISVKELIKRGDTHLQGLKFQTALVYLRKALLNEPRNAEIYYLIGRCLWFLKDYDGVIDYVKQAIRFDPSNDDYYDQLAFTYLKLNRFEDALKMCRKAKQLNPKYWAHRSTLATIYGALGYHTKAIKELRTAVRMYAKQPCFTNIITKDGFFLCEGNYMVNSAIFNFGKGGRS